MLTLGLIGKGTSAVAATMLSDALLLAVWNCIAVLSAGDQINCSYATMQELSSL
jgi:hypothetical protein